MSKNTGQAKSGREYLKEIKKTLSMPSRDFVAWQRMSNGEKSLLIRNARLDKKLINEAGFACAKWSSIQPADQQKIREAAKRAAAWVNELELI